MAHSRLAFLMYFLGFTNLLFGWAHHIYAVPTAPWIRYLSYGISMTEWIILAKIIRNWRSTLQEAEQHANFLSYRFMLASDIWVFLNLFLALLISIPAVNVYTHGTHVTVAHSMGSSIGINTMILLASVSYLILDVTQIEFTEKQKKVVTAGLWITNLSLLIFWISLILSGVIKGQLVVENNLSFQEIMETIKPYLSVFAFAGIFIFIGLSMVLTPLLRSIFDYLRK